MMLCSKTAAAVSLWSYVPLVQLQRFWSNTCAQLARLSWAACQRRSADTLQSVGTHVDLAVEQCAMARLPVSGVTL